MKNCEGCDNMLSDDAEMCYVCYARVGEGIPRPHAKPLDTSKDWLIIGGTVFGFIILALILTITVDIDDDTMNFIGYITGGIGVISIIMKLAKK